MPTTPTRPGIQYPAQFGTLDPTAIQIIRNIYDNLFYLMQTAVPIRFSKETTLTLAKITVSGTDGSITISPEGTVSAYTAPT